MTKLIPTNNHYLIFFSKDYTKKKKKNKHIGYTNTHIQAVTKDKIRLILLILFRSNLKITSNKVYEEVTTSKIFFRWYF